MKILLLVREGSSCDYHRITLPFRYLPLENGEECQTITDMQETRASDFQGVSLVVICRHSHVREDLLSFLKRKYKFKVWVDVDDYWELYPQHYLYDNWKRIGVAEKI